MDCIVSREPTMLVCIDNRGCEGRLTIGKRYLSIYEYLFDTYCLLEDDRKGKLQLYQKKLFKVTTY